MGLYSAGHDMDLHRARADIITGGGTDGVISGYSGVEELQQQLGEWVLDTVGRTLHVCAS